MVATRMKQHLARRSQKITQNARGSPFRAGFGDGIKAPIRWLVGKSKKASSKIAQKAQQTAQDEKAVTAVTETVSAVRSKWKNRAFKTAVVTKVVALKAVAVKVSLVALPATVVSWLGYATYRGVRNKRKANAFLQVQKKHLGRLMAWSATTDPTFEQELRRHSKVSISEDGVFVFDGRRNANQIPTADILKWLSWYRTTPTERVREELSRMRDEIVETNAEH